MQNVLCKAKCSTKGNTALDMKSAHPLLLDTRKPGYCITVPPGGTYSDYDYDDYIDLECHYSVKHSNQGVWLLSFERYLCL